MGFTGRHWHLWRERRIVSTKTVFILSASSDIGRELAHRFLKDGFRVIGTYRTIYKEKSLQLPVAMESIRCDLEKPEDISNLVSYFEDNKYEWDVFISSVGELRPIGLFFQTRYDDWEKSFLLNSSLQLKVLHALYPFRSPKKTSDVVFFAGGGTNNPFTGYSAYCMGKIALIKMCELLDDEAKDLNVFISGPGWTRTKGHDATIEACNRAGLNYERTKAFIDSEEQGTTFDDIYNHIRWGMKQGREIAGGRNFSIKNDAWKGDSRNLEVELKDDQDKYKLRRYGNEN